MRNKLFAGIFGHFFLRASVIQTISGLMLLAVVLPFFDYIATKMAAEQGRTFANSTLAASSDALFNNEYGEVVDYCMNVIKDTPNILLIVFSKKNGQELIINPKKWAIENKSLPFNKIKFNYTALADELNNAYYIRDNGSIFNDASTFEFSRPVFIGGRDWGILTIVFSKKAYYSSIKNFYWTVIIFTISACLLSFYLFFASSRRIRKQINTFEIVANQLSDGELSVRASENSIGEIGVLGKAINEMSSALAEKSERLFQMAQIVEQTDDAFILFDASFNIIFVNDAVTQLTAYPSSYLIGMSMVDLSAILNFSLSELFNEIELIGATKQHTQAKDVVVRKKDQSLIDVEIRLEMIVNDKDKYLLVVLSDVAERKHVEAEIRIAATAFESQEGIIVTDAKKKILRVNHAFTLITGYTAEDAVGQSPKFLSSGQHDLTFYTAIWDSLNSIGNWEGEIFNRRKSGEVYPEHLTITAVKDNGGRVTNYVATLTDITLRKAAEDEIQHLAFYDPLTGLPNRRLLLDRLKQAIAYSARSGRGGALLFLDLDHFKLLNDTLGHHMGDLLLQQVALRLESCVREGDTVARLGGDEFVIMLENLSEQVIEAAAQTEDISEKILVMLNKPYQLATHEYQCTPSIGVVLINNQNQSQEELLKQADIAMYQAKKAGRNMIRFFDPQMQANITVRVGMEQELRKALELKQFQLYYQIQVDSSGKPLGAEALIRWLHPERGLIPPCDFIALAEETGLILPIGIWVLESACAQLKAWQQDARTQGFNLSINVSAKQFRQVDFVEQVQMVVERNRINPDRLKLELTESVLLDDVKGTIETMNALKKIGIKFSLDDFGTGYSSLQYLKKLPIYQLKIDQSFVRDISTNASDKAIVRTIIAMARSLNFEVIAEGVETEEQQNIIMTKGCEQFQGYLFGRPIPIEQFEASLAQFSGLEQDMLLTS